MCLFLNSVGESARNLAAKPLHGLTTAVLLTWERLTRRARLLSQEYCIMKKTDRRVQRTRELLQKALVELIGEREYDAITIQDIADRASVGNPHSVLSAL